MIAMPISIVLALVAPAEAVTGVRFGLAADSGGTGCVSLEGDRLVAGTEVIVVDPEPPQTIFAATVESHVPKCEVLERAAITGNHYRVRWNSPRPRSPLLGVVILGARRASSVEGIAGVELSTQVPAARVRKCTSLEGVHVSVWSGAPLKSTRLWHHYWYLGYDVEPTCEDRDV